MIAPGQLSLHPPVVLLLEDPQPDLALDRSRLLSGHVSIFGASRPLRFGRSSQMGGRHLASRQASLPARVSLSGMTDIGDSLFHKGQPVWVIQGDGSQRAAEYVGEGEMSAWFGGSPSVIVVYPDDHSGGMVEVDRVIAREA
jgi:hypothetical protein